jgi:phosphatidylserine/phosphatidylglycerophosphate/cardiolipin synthase-like enzyme
MKIRKYTHSRYILLFCVLSLSIAACSSLTPGLPTQIPGPAGLGTPQVSNWIEIYFTDPASPRAAEYLGGPDEDLATAIGTARLSVDVAAYSLNLWSLRDALIQASRRGVVVRLVMESDNMDNQEVQEIRDAGIPIIGDQHEGLMHNKFVVIDRSEVWTGSMNFTTSGAYQDNNNLIRIRSTQVAEDYTLVFNEMFEKQRFGPGARNATANPIFSIDGTKVEIYFSPEDGIAAHILSLLDGARESIYFMAYSFTSNDLGNAIRERAADGLTVSGVMDDSQILSNPGTEYDAFMQAGLDLRRDGNAGQMHHKVIIIDRNIVITGSYNFSNSAETSNDENVVIIHDADIAALFLEELQRVYDQAQP